MIKKLNRIFIKYIIYMNKYEVIGVVGEGIL